MPVLKERTHQLAAYLKTGIWLTDTGSLSKLKAAGVKLLRVLLLTIQGFVRDNGALRASALTFYSLLSIVPVMALVFGIAKGFGFEQKLESQLYLRLAGQEEVLQKIISFSRTLLENTKGGVVAGIGVLVLFWSAVKVLGHIEKALNEIWKVRARSFIRRFTDYLAIMIVSPLLVIVSSSINVYITTQVEAVAEKLTIARAVGPFIYLMLKLLPFGLLWTLFVLIYMVMPNTRVRLKSALTAGILAGTIYQLSQGFYIAAQVLVAKYNAIYGSFAALPLFLIWLQISWMIVILGAHIAYAHQYMEHHVVGIGFQETSVHTKKQYGLAILRSILLGFKAGRSPRGADDIAAELNLPYLLVDKLLKHLVEINMVSVVLDDDGEEHAFQPARDIHTYTVASALEAWDELHRADEPAENGTNTGGISEAMRQFYLDCRNSKSNRLLIDL